MNPKQWLMRVLATSLCLMCFCSHAYSNEEVVEISLQTVKAVKGIVSYPNGDVVKGAKVAELTSDWKTQLRETRTDAEGRFELAPVKGRKVYYLQITVPEATGINPLRVSVKINRLWGKGLLRLRLRLA